MPTRCLRSLTRVLLAAMLLAVLAPAASRALSRTRVAGDWVEICTAQGMQWVQWTSERTPAERGHTDDPLHALDHCGHCTLQTDRFAPLLPSLPARGRFRSALCHPIFLRFSPLLFLPMALLLPWLHPPSRFATPSKPCS